jgi:hypothetical protein
MQCPVCGNLLHESVDKASKFKERACLVCHYYESNSLAYKEHPEFFRNIGKCYFARRTTELSKLGLSEIEAEGWLEQEPNFPRDILRKVTGRKSDEEVPEPLASKVYIFVTCGNIELA